VSGSADPRTKNVRKLSVGGPESGPLAFHSINVTGTNTSVPRINPSRQTLRPVNGRHNERRYNDGKKRKIVVQ
jgi:hypothetical protein